MENENRRRPERWRSGIGITVLTVERFSPLMKGTAFAGANSRGWKAFLWRVPPFLCAVKEMGVHIKRKRQILRNHRNLSGIIPPPSRLNRIPPVLSKPKPAPFGKGAFYPHSAKILQKIHKPSLFPAALYYIIQL